MKIRSFLIYAISFLLLIFLASLYLWNLGSRKVPSYPTQTNRLTIAMGKNWKEIASQKKARIESDQPFDYAVIDNEGNLLQYTREGISTSVSSATTRYDVIRDVVTENGEIVGKIIVHNTYHEQQVRRNRIMAAVVVGILLLMLGVTALYFFYLKKRVVDPFDEMKDFASKVASGNLDVPIKMDKGNAFGAFTGAFDIMREELHASKLREAEAVKARKELVAQLSHDIKTPVTSIKAMTDVMDQIDSLVSNLFHATLEELEHLEVNVEEVTSKEIEGSIADADYLKKVNEVKVVDAVVRADRLRLNQIIGNVFANSYKYANTEITVGSHTEKSVDGKDFLVLEIGDKGGGVPDEEIETIFGKFKRGSNTDGKDGAGLGLYISRYLMEKMGGEITAVNKNGGLTVVLRLLLL